MAKPVLEKADWWKIFDTDLALYKFYMELLLKGAAVALALTGGVVSYCLAQKAAGLIRWSLLLPTLVNFGFALICLVGSWPAKMLATDHDDTCRMLGMENPYDLKPLCWLLWTSSVSYAAIGAGLLVLLRHLRGD
ncbi:MAG TPA: hypothetical protein VN719_03745 [Gemmatimonadales bacterium]|jgi:hypothetical protein|nr:hypothetical protein [Gemmatimonadales bacterium]